MIRAEGVFGGPDSMDNLAQSAMGPAPPRNVYLSSFARQEVAWASQGVHLYCVDLTGLDPAGVLLQDLILHPLGSMSYAQQSDVANLPAKVIFYRAFVVGE